MGGWVEGSEQREGGREPFYVCIGHPVTAIVDVDVDVYDVCT